MSGKIFSSVLLALVLSVFGYVFYLGYYEPYVLLPKRDEFFLELHPDRQEVLAQFGSPNEQLGPGDRFQASGWYPVPRQPAESTALSFVRMYSGKIYVFFDSRGTVKDYVFAQR